MGLVIFEVEDAYATDSHYSSGKVYALYSEEVNDEESARKLFWNDGMGDIRVDSDSIKLIPMKLGHESGLLIGKPAKEVLDSLQSAVDSLKSLPGVSPVVHILQWGAPLCAFSGEPPSGWPPGHKWVALKDKEQATCVPCKSRAAEMKA